MTPTSTRLMRTVSGFLSRFRFALATCKYLTHPSNFEQQERLQLYVRPSIYKQSAVTHAGTYVNSSPAHDGSRVPNRYVLCRGPFIAHRTENSPGCSRVTLYTTGSCWRGGRCVEANKYQSVSHVKLRSGVVNVIEPPTIACVYKWLECLACCACVQRCVQDESMQCMS